MPHSSPSDETRPIRARVQNACDSCKSRKVKCDGKSPCSYCVRRRRSELCHYSPQRKRVPQHARSPSIPTSTSASSSSALHQPQHQRQHQHQHHDNGHHHQHTNNGSGVTTPNLPPRNASFSSQHVDHMQTSSPAIAPAAVLPPHHQPQPPPSTGTTGATAGGGGDVGNAFAPNAHDDETEVPREARLLCDAQGKLIFIGDCAPLSFFQSVRQLVTSRVDEHAFAPQSSQYSVLENSAPSAAFSATQNGGGPGGGPEIPLESVPDAVAVYLAVTAGLVDLFEDARLRGDITLWASAGSSSITDGTGTAAASDVATSIVHYLILAIGYQKDREPLAQACFEYARDRAFAHLSGELSISTVHAFLLVTLFMLGACQINGAFLFFGIAVRTAYSIGIHRTEVNARFGPDGHVQRDRLWRSLRVVDLFLSTSMGRPPATSDVDCTVPYKVLAADGREESFDILSSSVQIFLILECVVLEVYSRRKITLQLTEGISRQLRDWSGRWLRPLKEVLTTATTTSTATNSGETDSAGGSGRTRYSATQQQQLIGTCQVLSSYYYAVMLVSRPFLMYEVRRRLSDGPGVLGVAGGAGGGNTKNDIFSGKSRLADACIDAASMMVDVVASLIERGVMTGKQPLIVSWLFASSLALGVGLLGSFGRILERYTQKSIAALEHFAKSDAHAMQYSLIAKSLLATALGALEKRELAERLQRAESSSQLFGLMPVERGVDGGGSGSGSGSGNGSGGAGAGAALRSPESSGMDHRESFARSEILGGHHLPPQQQNHHQHHMAAPSSPGRFVDLDPAFLSLSGGSLPETPDLSFLNSTFSGDQGSGALNLFPLLETSGHIDLAHYF
ncbi:positive regulator of PUT (proline utilization) [Apiospora aurea]|uniref:Positive regulator of PUT (Proline utilization) n=1 Tax=Apiospora aurea TaxID=335848 RepID=A0ABR1Q042_9PEZI